MSVELHSMIGTRSVLMGMDARGSEPMVRDESEVPMTQAPPEVGSMCGSNTAEYAASAAGLSFPSLDGAIYSGSRARAVTGAIS